ncbi:MAG: class I SAM-dependent methyltransferase [Pseudomonadota bacterium]
MSILEQRIGRPIANISFAMMQGYIRSMQRRGVGMLHTARPFSFYRKVFYQGKSEAEVLFRLREKRIVDIGCGYTPYATNSMFRACHDAGIEFYGVDPLIEEDQKIGIRERLLARATGGSARFDTKAPGLERAISTTAQDLPFADGSVDEILCSYLLFVWIEDEQVLSDILQEFLRVLKPGGQAKIYPLFEWRYLRFKNPQLKDLLRKFDIQQTFVHGGTDFRVSPSMLTVLTKH